MPAQQQSFILSAFLSSATPNVPAGTVLCLSADGTIYVIATLANRTANGRSAACIALTSGDRYNAAVDAQVVGPVPSDISGLGAGTASLINVSDAGILQRTASADNTVVGGCDADGTAYVCFPMAGLTPGGGGASGPVNSVQFDVGGGVFGGAAHASISSDGRTEHGADRSGGAASQGDDRHAAGGRVFVRTFAGTSDDCVWSHSQLTGSGSLTPVVEILDIGRDRAANNYQPDYLNTWGQYGGAFGALLRGNTIPSAAMGIFGAGYSIANPNAAFAFGSPNLGITPNGFSPLSGVDPTKAAKGIFFIAPWVTAPTTGPDAGWLFLRAQASTGHPEVLLHGDDPSTGWRDLLAANDEANYLTTGATTTSSINVAGVGHLSATASGSIATSALTAPAAGAAKRIVLSNDNADSATWTLKHNSGGDSTSDRFDLPGSVDFVIGGGDAYISYYNHSESRFKLAKGA